MVLDDDGIDTDRGSHRIRQIRFQVATKRKGNVYMLATTELMGYSILIVDTSRLLKAWRANLDTPIQGPLQVLIDPLVRKFGGPYAAYGRDKWLPYQSRVGMTRDYKFHHAENGFSRGLGDPVPLAELGSGRYPGRSVDFSNGVTRTIWLIANEASFFPVLVRSNDAENVFALAGALGTAVLDLNSLCE
jgi:hypothetical protein